MSNFNKIIEFHKSFGLHYSDTVSIQNITNPHLSALRIALIVEEFCELQNAHNITEQLDAIGDLLYVVYGAGASFGFDMDTEFRAFFEEYRTTIIEMNKNFNTTVYTFIPHLSNFQNILGLFRDTQQIPEKSPDIAYFMCNVVNFSQKIKNLELYISTYNCNKIKNTLTDMLFTLYSSGCVCGYDLDKLFSEIHYSNMTKLCHSEDEAITTVDWYLENQSLRYPSPCYEKSSDGNNWVVFEETTGKRLKSINYIEPHINVQELKLIA